MYERGFSLIECLSVLCVVALIGAGISSFTGSSIQLFRDLSEELEGKIAARMAHGALQMGVRAHERGRFEFGVTIVRGDHLASQHPLSSLNSSSAPQPDSDVASFIELSPPYRAAVSKSSFQDTEISLEACGINALSIPSTFKSYVAIGVSGALQIVGTIRAISPSCIELTGQAIRGLVSSTTLPAPAALLEFAPVAREYSIFIDRSGQLRLASHVGSRILENQPLARRLHSFTVTPLSDPSGALSYHLAVKTRAARPFESLLIVGLAQRGVWNEIFQ